jgi:hypothetical protein
LADNQNMATFGGDSLATPASPTPAFLTFKDNPQSTVVLPLVTAPLHLSKLGLKRQK